MGAAGTLRRALPAVAAAARDALVGCIVALGSLIAPPGLQPVVTVWVVVVFEKTGTGIVMTWVKVELYRLARIEKLLF